jgi:hypothetical protein
MKHLLAIAASALHAAAWAHPGHGIDGPGHWHATDLWGLAIAASAAAWLWSRRK